MNTRYRGPQVEGIGRALYGTLLFGGKNAVRTDKNNQWHHGSNTLKWPLFTSFMSWVPPLSDFDWRRDCGFRASKPRGLSLPSFRISGFKILVDVNIYCYRNENFQIPQFSFFCRVQILIWVIFVYHCFQWLNIRQTYILKYRISMTILHILETELCV